MRWSAILAATRFRFFSTSLPARRWQAILPARCSWEPPPSMVSSATRRLLFAHESGLDIPIKLDLNQFFRSLIAVSHKTISIMTPCYNEEENVLSLYNQVR